MFRDVRRTLQVKVGLNYASMIINLTIPANSQHSSEAAICSEETLSRNDKANALCDSSKHLNGAFFFWIWGWAFKS